MSAAACNIGARGRAWRAGVGGASLAGAAAAWTLAAGPGGIPALVGLLVAAGVLCLGQAATGC